VLIDAEKPPASRHVAQFYPKEAAVVGTPEMAIAGLALGDPSGPC
jgi:hypothetical protein